MTVAAGEPACMCQMRETDIGHLCRIRHQNIQIQCLHWRTIFRASGVRRSGIDDTLIQGLDPVDLATPVFGEVFHRLFGILEDVYRFNSRVMNAVPGQWRHRRGLEVKGHGRSDRCQDKSDKQQ